MVDLAQSFLQGRQLGQQNRLGQLASQAYSVAPEGQNALLGQIAEISPQAAAQQQQQFNQGEDRSLQQLRGFVGYVNNQRKTGNPAAVNAALRAGAPLIERLTGKPAPTEWTPDMDAGWSELEARVAQQTPTGQPAGYQQFDMIAKAAGLQPGTPEYEQAAKVNLGIEGRASSSGFTQVKVTGADGRDRVGVLNGRTGQIDLPDGTSFNPQTGQIAPTTSLPQSGGMVDGPNGQAFIEPGLSPDQLRAVEADMAANAGADNYQLANRDVSPQAFRGGNQLQTSQLVVGSPNAFVGRAPEEQAAATEAAKISTQLQFLPEQGRIEAQNAGLRETATQTAQNQANKAAGRNKAQLSLDQATSRIGRVDTLVESILPRINGLTAGWAGGRLSNIDGTAAADLRKDIGTLQAIAGFDELNAMRAASPTGGALGNVTERELGFLQSVVRNIENSQSPEQLRRNLTEFQKELRGSWERVNAAYQQDYGQSNQSGGRQPPATGTVQDGYRFRGGNPADPNSWERI